MVHGFKKFVFVNGNRVANLPPMEIAASKLRLINGAFVGVLDVGLIARNEVAAIVGATEAGLGHAGDAETSYTLYKFPHLVDMSQAAAAPRRDMESQFAFNHITLDPGPQRNVAYVKQLPHEFRVQSEPHGLTGDATTATKEKGALIYEAVVANAATFIESIKHIEVMLRNVGIPA